MRYRGKDCGLAVFRIETNHRGDWEVWLQIPFINVPDVKKALKMGVRCFPLNSCLRKLEAVGGTISATENAVETYLISSLSSTFLCSFTNMLTIFFYSFLLLLFLFFIVIFSFKVRILPRLFLSLILAHNRCLIYVWMNECVNEWMREGVNGIAYTLASCYLSVWNNVLVQKYSSLILHSSPNYSSTGNPLPCNVLESDAGSPDLGWNFSSDFLNGVIKLVAIQYIWTLPYLQSDVVKNAYLVGWLWTFSEVTYAEHPKICLTLALQGLLILSASANTLCCSKCL